MSTWFKDRRQEFIATTLRQFGQVRRADLMRQFDISMPQASKDIADFLANDPPFVTYDTTAKAYVLNDPPRRPSCGVCHDTGYVDFAHLGLDRCDHTPPAAIPADAVGLKEALANLYGAVNKRAVRGHDHVPSMREEQKAMLSALAVLRALPGEPSA